MDNGTVQFIPKARLMLLLGQELITDETAALSELIKNSYDADAKHVKVILHNVSDKKNGSIVIMDDGNGMSKEQLLGSWLEIGTSAKSRKKDEPVKMSEGGRVYLGEKGLGRLAVHKLGKQIMIETRRKPEIEESKSTAEKKPEINEFSLNMNWDEFDNVTSLLTDVGVNWTEKTPTVFIKGNSEIDSDNGTKITITNLHRSWTEEMIEKIKRFVMTSYSFSFVALKDFDVDLKVDDPKDIDLKFAKSEEIFKTAPYTFIATIDESGFVDYQYVYKSGIHSDLNRNKNKKTDLKDPDEFYRDRNPTCGPFKFTIYCWDLDSIEKKAAFTNPKYWNEVVRPLTGFKLFRDGFRVLPYGNIDNDWLNMDQRRVRRFQENVSREQVIAFVEISSTTNPKLLDKSDREGLIDNDEFQDFKNLILSTMDIFQNERNFEREKIKKEKRIDARTEKLSENLNSVIEILDRENIRPESKKKIIDTIWQSTNLIDQIIDLVETPLLGAASLGITYAIPTHEIRRNVREAKRLLTKSESPVSSDVIKIVIDIMIEIENEIKGIVKISEATQDDEEFEVKKPFETAIELMKYKLERNEIKFDKDFRIGGKIKGTERLLTISILNFIDNGIYWLGKRKNDKQMRFIIDKFHDEIALVVSDNGPGIDDGVELVSMPFYTRKSKGMGLGLYISRRAAEIHGGKLFLFDQGALPRLLEGASIGILLPKKVVI